MDSIESIYEDILKAPTAMDLSMEISFCRRLVVVDLLEIEANWTLTSQIFERLCESHMDAIYELTSRHETTFFTDWLKQVATKINTSARQNEIAGVIEIFSCALEAPTQNAV